MSGKSIIVVGARGTGKTTNNREMISKVHPDARLILDVNGEYKDLFPHEMIGFKEFTTMITKVKGAVILIEEATIFLSNRGYNGDIVDVLVKARHRDNTIIFSFHSFNTIPNYVWELSNYVYIFKTNDDLDTIKSYKKPKLEAAFTEIQNADWLKGENGKQYSPKKLVNLYD